MSESNMTKREILLMNIRCGEAAFRKVDADHIELRQAAETIPQENYEEVATAYAEICAYTYGMIFLRSQLETMKSELVRLDAEGGFDDEGPREFTSLDDVFKSMGD